MKNGDEVIGHWGYVDFQDTPYAIVVLLKDNLPIDF